MFHTKGTIYLMGGPVFEFPRVQNSLGPATTMKHEYGLVFDPYGLGDILSLLPRTKNKINYNSCLR